MDDSAYDAIVIGSGAGGGASAWALADKGLKVLLLEAGPAYDPSRDYRLNTPGWERSGFPHKVPTQGRQTFALLQRLEERWSRLRSWNHLSGRYNPGDTRVAWGYHHVVGLGGSTLHFTGEAHRLHPQAMRMQSRFGAAADWPLDYAELEPDYCRVERTIGVAGPAAAGARWRSEPHPLPAHALSYAGKHLETGCRKLGLSWEQNSLAILSRPRDGRPGCNYCANCNRGCPRRDKGSADVTLIAKARATGRCTIRTGCQVVRLEPGRNDRIRGVHYTDAQGRVRFEPARAVIVACGAVETPRLLLASESSAAPHGLANESGQVGRNFMETLAWVVSGLHPQPLGSHRGVPADGICWDYNAPDAIEGVIGGCRFSHATAEAEFTGPLSYARRVVGGWGRTHQERMVSTFGRVLSVGAMGEFLPNPGTYVDLDPTARDPQGIPRARIHSHVEEGDLARLAFMAGRAQEILRAAGVNEIFEAYGTYDGFNSTHVFGTCRMGGNPESSVVDSRCRSHRWRNLWITDASVFPSSGGGEAPSLTIAALAVRAAGAVAGSMLGRAL